MDQHSKRLLVFAVLVSFIFNSSAYNYNINAAASTDEEDTSIDHILNTSNYDPVTHICGIPQPDPNPTAAAVTEEDSQDTTEFEPSTAGGGERVCLPGTTLCNNPDPDPKPTKEAVTDEDATESDSVSNSIKTDSVIPETICNVPPTDGGRGCHGPIPDSVISKPTNGDLPEQDNSNSKIEPNNPSNQLVCDPITHQCGRPNPQLVVSDQYGKAAKIEDTVIQDGQNGINNFACTTNPDGSRTCRGPHHASDFGIAQPRDVSA